MLEVFATQVWIVSIAAAIVVNGLLIVIGLLERK